MHTPDFFTPFRVDIMPVPNAYNVLALANADGTATDLRPFVLGHRPAVVELVADDGKDEIFPDAVRNALTEAYDPLAPSDVEWVFPDGPTNPSVKEEVVSCRKECRRCAEVRPQRPEGFDLDSG